MGVDITAYTNIRKSSVTDDEDSDGFHAYDNPNFAGRACGLVTGTYEYDDAVEGLSLSYGGYNQWRNRLAEIAGWPAVEYKREYETIPRMRHDAAAWQAESGPFWELINFADNEGTIGTEVCAKLARDFAEFQSKADALQRDHGFFKRTYDSMRAAFEAAAANRGAVNFS